MVSSFLLAQLHVQIANVFGDILVIAMPNLSIAKSLGPLPFDEILDQQARAVVVASVLQTVADRGVVREGASFLGEVLIHDRTGEVGTHDCHGGKWLEY